METPERLNADIAMLLFPRQMVFLVALAYPARRLSILALSLVRAEDWPR